MYNGRRYSYDNEQKLNKKKVVAVIIAILVVMMAIIAVIKVLNTENKSLSKKNDKYFASMLNGKWGVINSKGVEIVTSEYEEMIVVPNNSEEVFICTYDVNYEDGTYKSKAVNSKNTQIFGKYEKVEAIQNSDKSNNIWYSKDVLKVCKDGKYGLINYKGKLILKCEYSNIYAVQGVDNSFIIEKDNKKGIVNNKAEKITEPKYTEINALTENFVDGYIVKNEEEKSGVISARGEQILECKYEEIENITSNNIYVVKDNSGWKLIDLQGQEYLQDAFDKVKDINGENILIEKDELCGVVNISNEIMIPIQYKSMKHAFDDNYIAEKSGKFGVINIKNETKVEFKYEGIDFRDEIQAFDAEKQNYESDIINKNFEVKLSGIISEINEKKSYIKLRTENEYKYYTFEYEQFANNSLEGKTLFLDKQNGKYGFINKNGIVVVDYVYDDAIEQNEYGYSAIKMDGLWGAIDSEGKIVVEPKYDLENNTIIDFIKDWHYAEDVNANYYTK